MSSFLELFTNESSEMQRHSSLYLRRTCELLPFLVFLINGEMLFVDSFMTDYIHVKIEEEREDMPLVDVFFTSRDLEEYMNMKSLTKESLILCGIPVQRSDSSYHFKSFLYFYKDNHGLQTTVLLFDCLPQDFAFYFLPRFFEDIDKNTSCPNDLARDTLKSRVFRFPLFQWTYKQVVDFYDAVERFERAKNTTSDRMIWAIYMNEKHSKLRLAANGFKTVLVVHLMGATTKKGADLAYNGGFTIHGQRVVQNNHTYFFYGADSIKLMKEDKAENRVFKYSCYSSRQKGLCQQKHDHPCFVSMEDGDYVRKIGKVNIVSEMPGQDGQEHNNYLLENRIESGEQWTVSP
eukprot:GHVS01091207.1.p1 GENE.GHVS01091207.1~~GHVS01091207.1.p1  ORF type:complete len:348 (-),score=16.67 GHVS01091207.1:271-1314(-)